MSNSTQKNIEHTDVRLLGFSIPFAIIDFLQSIVVALLICIFVYVVIAMPNQIEGNSMIPNFHNGEIILTSKINHWLGNTSIGNSLDLDYKRGDVVVFQKPGFNDFIKRLIGMPKDRIALRDGDIYINGKKLVESYLPENTYTRGGDFLENNGDEITVPEGKYFMVGDNRQDSHDSRYADIGFVSRDWMKGKVILRYWPIQSFKVVNDGNFKFE